MKKSFWPVFSRFLECERPQGPFFEYPQAIPTNTFEVDGLILLHLRGCWKHKILKKRQTFQWKKFLFYFLPNCRMWQTSGDNFWGSTWYFDNYCGSYRNNSVTPKKLLKTQFFEKKGKLSSEEKKIGPNFVSLSTVTNLSEQFKRVHNVFWQLLWKLGNHFCNA